MKAGFDLTLVACGSCRFFSDLSDPEDDPKEVDGYCGHPNHSLPASPHHEYGGHWTHSSARCELYEKDEVISDVRTHQAPDHLSSTSDHGTPDRRMGAGGAPTEGGHEQNCPALVFDGDDRAAIDNAKCLCQKRWRQEASKDRAVMERRVYKAGERVDALTIAGEDFVQYQFGAITCDVFEMSSAYLIPTLISTAPGSGQFDAFLTALLAALPGKPIAFVHVLNAGVRRRVLARGFGVLDLDEQPWVDPQMREALAEARKKGMAR